MKKSNVHRHVWLSDQVFRWRDKWSKDKKRGWMCHARMTRLQDFCNCPLFDQCHKKVKKVKK